MIFTIIFASLLSLLKSEVHPIHISRSEINYDTEGRSLQITLHVFIDDLEDAMVLEGLANPKIGAKSELKNSDQLISTYISKKLLFYNSKNEPLTLTWIGKELGDSPLALVCYFEIENLRTATGLSVKNDIIMDLHSDQVNIMETFMDNRPKNAFHIKKKGVLKGLEF
ncbi:MAG TPA: hypothetical protein PKD85_15130 [Saprospiraceae bacterium]|nr:hypothetical protein [Saprospiraceae bacterium]